MGVEEAGTMKATSNGAWQGDNPLNYAVPLLILQICLVVVVTRAIAYVLRPLRQPRVIAEIIGGVLLGPSAVGRIETFKDNVFPKSSITVLDTVANIGLLFFLFLVGLELDLRSIRRTGKKALSIAIAGISLPFVLGIGASVILRNTVNKGVSHGPFLVFMGVALSITAFPVLARILAELKLLTTDVGSMAMSAAAVNDIVAWILLALAIALSGSGSPLITLWVLLTGIGFVIFASVAIRPVLAWMARRSPEGEPVKEIYICATLVTVLASAFVTDAMGIHALFGSFIVGVVVPKDGPFAGVLIEKIEDLVSSLFLPLYFVSSGLKTNVATISGAQAWGLLVLLIFVASFGKIVATIGVSMLARFSFQEALALGVLMNTKGLVELIVLNIGKDRNVLTEETFAILVLMALVTTFITTPIVMVVYKPARPAAPYRHRTIQRPDPESELRIMTCFHSVRNIPTMINLIESSRGTRRRGITIYAVHLMELSERSSAISMVHKARRNGLPFWNKRRVDGDHIIAFEAYQQLNSVYIRPMTVISDFSDIHEDIVTSARQKRAALVILPFHKQQSVDGVLESLGHSYHHINQKVLRCAPCSVGILVDRGFGGTSQVTASKVSYNIAVLFFGGADDREALSYGLRMAEHPGIILSVVRFMTPTGNKPPSSDTNSSVSIDMEGEQRLADDEYIAEFQKKIAPENESISYEENTITNAQEVVSKVKSLEPYNLFLVGRSPPIAPLLERTDCPEMGPVGSYLASSEFSTTASVLVIQQYDSKGSSTQPSEETAEIYDEPDTPVESVGQSNKMNHSRP